MHKKHDFSTKIQTIDLPLWTVRHIQTRSITKGIFSTVRIYIHVALTHYKPKNLFIIYTSHDVYKKKHNYLLPSIVQLLLRVLEHLLTPKIKEVVWICVELQSVFAILPEKEKFLVCEMKKVSKFSLRMSWVNYNSLKKCKFFIMVDKNILLILKNKISLITF